MRVLVFCTGNTCRSPVAEAALQKALIDTKIHVCSAGIRASTGQSASEGSLIASRVFGFDLGNHKSQATEQSLVYQTDWAIGMTKMHLIAFRRLFPDYSGNLGLLGLPGKSINKLADTGTGVDISDPWHGSQQSYDSMVKLVVDYCDQWADFLTQESCK